MTRRRIADVFFDLHFRWCNPAVVPYVKALAVFCWLGAFVCALVAASHG